MLPPRLALAAALLLILEGCSGTADRQDVAALVDDEVVTWADVDRALKHVPGATPASRRSMLRQLVERGVALRAIRRAGIVVCESELDQALREEIERLGGEREHERWLRLRCLTAAERRVERREEMLVDRLRAHLGVGPKGLRAALMKGVRIEPPDLFEED